MVRPDIHEIVKKSLSIGKNLMFYLPRTIDINELFEIIHSCNNEKIIYLNVHILKSANKIKAILLLYGPSIIDLKMSDLYDIIDYIFFKFKSQRKKLYPSKKDIIFIKKNENKEEYDNQEEYIIENKNIEDNKFIKEENSLDKYIFKIFSLLGMKKFIESLENYKNKLEKEKMESHNEFSCDSTTNIIDNDQFIKRLIEFFITEVLTGKQLTRFKK